MAPNNARVSDAPPGEKVPHHSATVIVEDDREPGLCERLTVAHEQQIEKTVIGLPEGIWPIGFASIQQIELLRVCFGAVVSQGHEGG
jgi:hypothetical protein